MRTLDEQGNELKEYDLEHGYITQEEINSTYHPAQEFVQEQGHYKTIAEYPNGGKDVEWVVDVPGQEAHDAYYDKETIQRYHPYPEEELAKRKAAKEEAEEQQKKLDSLFSSEMTIGDIVDTLAELTYGGNE